MAVPENPEPMGIEVEFRPERAPAFAAVVRLSGEHDLATSTSIREALAPIDGNVLVDLSECEFFDSSVIGAFVADSQTRAREGKRLALFVHPENLAIARTVQIFGLASLLAVHAPEDFD